MSSINVLSESNFDSIVGSKPALIDFGAEWCVYCKKIAPVIEEIASEHPELVVGSIDVDLNPMLAARFRVHSLPTVLVMKDGQVVTPTTDKTGTYDVVVSNILADVIIPLQKEVVRHMKTGAYLLVSGIIDSKREALLEAFRKNEKLTLLGEDRLGEWMGFVLQKSGK